MLRAILLVGVFSASTAVAAAQYRSEFAQTSSLCKGLKADLIKARFAELSDEQLCGLDVKKLVPQVKFVEWKPQNMADPAEFLTAVFARGHLPKDGAARYDPELTAFVLKAVKDGAATTSQASISIDGHNLTAQRIDVAPCRAFRDSPYGYYQHMYREQVGLPAYNIFMKGRQVPFTIPISGFDLGFARGSPELIGVSVLRSWATDAGKRSTFVEIYGFSFNDPSPDSTNPIDQRASFLPYFWVHTLCEVKIETLAKEGGHG
ncbi:hypothetical protein [Pinirhizobacter soli]|uniref:hypothetical protein n=1 Tax=Pinirhizobacter soli TaxID=2786953 RepID=UPI00202A63A3|nr:hypothetical protein [Pinirhizobacter soli]